MDLDLGLDIEVKEAIVKGISTGYADFLTQQQVFEKELVVSTAFSWMRSNYIDSALAKNVPKKMKYEVKSAGAWKYIAFELLVENATYRFVIKPPVALESLKDGEYYLSENSQVNKKFVESEMFKQAFSIHEQTVLDECLSIPKQMTLFNGNEEDRFYIITYDVDIFNGLNEIEIYVPYEGNAYQVESLTNLVSELGVSVPEELLKSTKEYDVKSEKPDGIDSSQFETLKIIKRKDIDKD